MSVLFSVNFLNENIAAIPSTTHHCVNTLYAKEILTILAMQCN